MLISRSSFICFDRKHFHCWQRYGSMINFGWQHVSFVEGYLSVHSDNILGWFFEFCGGNRQTLMTKMFWDMHSPSNKQKIGPISCQYWLPHPHPMQYSEHKNKSCAEGKTAPSWLIEIRSFPVRMITDIISMNTGQTNLILAWIGKWDVDLEHSSMLLL